MGAVLDGLNEHGSFRSHFHRPPVGRHYLRLRRQLIPRPHCTHTHFSRYVVKGHSLRLRCSHPADCAMLWRRLWVS